MVFIIAITIKNYFLLTFSQICISKDYFLYLIKPLLHNDVPGGGNEGHLCILHNLSTLLMYSYPILK